VPYALLTPDDLFGQIVLEEEIDNHETESYLLARNS